MGFAYRNGVLCAEDVSLDDIARRFGTPCYVYSRAAIEGAYGEYARALRGRDSLVCYSVKANSNLAVLATLARLGAGFDIVSAGELARVLAAGGDARKTLFSGVGKTEAEIAFALEKNILCLNLESESELARGESSAARRGRVRAWNRSRAGWDGAPRLHFALIRTSTPAPIRTFRRACARRNSALPTRTQSASTPRRRACRTSRWSASAATSARSSRAPRRLLMPPAGLPP